METQNTPYTGSDADACHYLLTMTLWAPPEEPFQGRRIAPCIHQDSTQLRPVTNWCLFVPSQSSLQSVVKCRLLPKNTESRSVLHVCCTWYICNMPLISDWKQRILWIEIGAIFAKFHHSNNPPSPRWPPQPPNLSPGWSWWKNPKCCWRCQLILLSRRRILEVRRQHVGRGEVLER